jgi:hypothetical protein
VTPAEALTDAERAAARVFLDDRLAGFRAMPEVTWQPPVYVHHIRHLCNALGKSVSFELKEVCQDSPAYLVGKDMSVSQFDGGDPLGCQDLIDVQEEAGLRHLSVIEAVVPEGRFTWIYREGRCPDCKMTARSANGRLADATLRPPLGRS